MVSLAAGDRLSIEISEVGAYLKSVRFDGREIIKITTDGVETHGGCAHLIPFANRVRNAKFSFRGKEYVLMANSPPNAMHGLIRGLNFDVRAGESKAEFNSILKESSFPWVYAVRIRYTIMQAGISIDYEVTNMSQTHGPLMIGAHPYFVFTGKWEAASMGFHELVCTDGYFPTGRLLDPVNILKPREGGYDTPFLVEGTLTLDLGDIRLELFNRGMPYFMFYDGKYSGGKSIAVEPMTGAPDCFNNGIGLVQLAPGMGFTCGFSMGFSWK